MVHVTINGTSFLSRAFAMYSVCSISIKSVERHRIFINLRSFHLSSDAYTKTIEAYGHNGALRSGTVLHAHLIVSGLARRTHFAAKLIDLYTGFGRLTDARNLFDKIPKTNVRRWIVLIGAYARHGFPREAMGVFCEMQRDSLRPNKFVLPSVLKACGHLSDWKTGEKIHAAILKYEFQSDAFVSSALIDMYSKCGQIERARRVFVGMVESDLVALNAMIAGYVQHGFVEKAWAMVDEMQLRGLKPNVTTWNTLIAGFAQAGNEVKVTEVFQTMRLEGVEPDVVTWTSVICGHVQNSYSNKAFAVFKHMLGLALHPTPATISSLLAACSAVADTRHGKQLHGYAVMIGVGKDVYVSSALIDMYSKCGLIQEAMKLFQKMSNRNTATWNSMIFGYANHGYCNEAIGLFNQMVKEDDKKLDYLTFIAALTACNHAGMFNVGQSIFITMQENYGIKPRLEHYACMVDLLGRGGQLAEAYDMIRAMPIEPDLFVWGALLGACRQHGNLHLAEIAAKELSKLEPESSGSSLLLSNLYACSGSWGNVDRVKKMMRKQKKVKCPGCSWIEVS